MGYKLKECRQRMKLSQDELARASGVSRVTISNIETGKTEFVGTKTLLKLASALGVSIDEIFFAESV